MIAKLKVSANSRNHLSKQKKIEQDSKIRSTRSKEIAIILSSLPRFQSS